jgi:hypothetical protein
LFIVCAEHADNTFSIVCAANATHGVVLANGAVVACSVKPTVSFAKGVAKIGGLIRYNSDGARWYVFGLFSSRCRCYYSCLEHSLQRHFSNQLFHLLLSSENEMVISPPPFF